MKIRNYIERLFVVVLLALVCVPTYADSFSVTYTPPKNLEIYDVTNFRYNPTGNYFVMPVYGSTFVSESYFTIFNIFADKSITSDVKVTLNVAAHSEKGSTNPSSSTFSLFGDSEHTLTVSAVSSGTPPSSTTATDMCYTVSKEEAINKFSNDLVINISKE